MVPSVQPNGEKHVVATYVVNRKYEPVLAQCNDFVNFRRARLSPLRSVCRRFQARLVAQGPQFSAGCVPPLAWLQIVEPDGADCDSDQTQCRMADRCSHAPHLSILPFMDHDLEP